MGAGSRPDHLERGCIGNTPNPINNWDDAKVIGVLTDAGELPSAGGLVRQAGIRESGAETTGRWDQLHPPAPKQQENQK